MKRHKTDSHGNMMEIEDTPFDREQHEKQRALEMAQQRPEDHPRNRKERRALLSITKHRVTR